MSSSESCSVAENFAKHASSVTLGSAARGAATSGKAPGAFTSPEKVPYPLEDELVFDVEVLYKIKKFPIISHI